MSDHSAGRNVEDWTGVKQPMTVSAYMDLDRSGNETFFDAYRWGEIWYERSAFHILDGQVIQYLSGIGAWHRRWNEWNGRGAVGFHSVGLVYMQLIRCREEEK